MFLVLPFSRFATTNTIPLHAPHQPTKWSTLVILLKYESAAHPQVQTSVLWKYSILTFKGYYVPCCVPFSQQIFGFSKYLCSVDYTPHFTKLSNSFPDSSSTTASSKRWGAFVLFTVIVECLFLHWFMLSLSSFFAPFLTGDSGIPKDPN